MMKISMAEDDEHKQENFKAKADDENNLDTDLRETGQMMKL